MISPRNPRAAVHCCAALAVLLVGPAWAESGPEQGPGAGEELRCVFDVTRETSGLPAMNLGLGDPAAPAAPPRTMPEPKRKEVFRLTVGLTRDTMVCEDPGGEPEVVAYDFPARRVTEVDRRRRAFRDLSLYAVVALRVNESINRFTFAASLGQRPKARGAGTGANAPPDPDPAPPDPDLVRCVDRFAVETLFSLRLKSVPPSPPGTAFLERPTIQTVPGPTGKGWHFLHDNDLAVDFVPSDRPVPPDYRRSLRHFLAYRCTIHPEIREKIVDSGLVPERLSYRSIEFFKRTDQTVTLQLASATFGPTRWHGPPARFAPAFDPVNPLDVVLAKAPAPGAGGRPGADGPAVAVAAAAPAGVDRKAGAPATEDPPTDRPALNRFVDAELKRGHALEAYLGWCEYIARTGDPSPDMGETIRKAAPPGTLLVSSHPAPTPEGADRQLRDLDAIDRKELAHGYMIDAIAGTILSALGRTVEAEGRWLKALDANPRLVGVYIQLGTNRFRAFQMVDAWRCFDAARRVDPRSPYLADISHLEARFEADFPDEF